MAAGMFDFLQHRQDFRQDRQPRPDSLEILRLHGEEDDVADHGAPLTTCCSAKADSIAQAPAQSAMRPHRRFAHTISPALIAASKVLAVTAIFAARSRPLTIFRAPVQSALVPEKKSDNLSPENSPSVMPTTRMVAATSSRSARSGCPTRSSPVTPRGAVQAYLLLAQIAQKNRDLAQATAYLERINSPQDAAKVLGPLWGNLDVATVEAANAHRSYQVQPVTVDQLGEQQKIADAFFRAGLLPRAVDAKDVQTWKP